MKIHDNAISDSVGTAIEETDLNLITQGDNYYNRQGASNVVKKLRVRLQHIPNASATYSQLRVMVVIWTDESANVPTVADIFEAPANQWLSPPLFASRQFKILYDKLYPPVIPGQDVNVIDFTLTKGLPTAKYTSGANTGVDHMFLLLIANDNTNKCDVIGHATVYFQDP